MNLIKKGCGNYEKKKIKLFNFKNVLCKMWT